MSTSEAFKLAHTQLPHLAASILSLLISAVVLSHTNGLEWAFWGFFKHVFILFYVHIFHIYKKTMIHIIITLPIIKEIQVY